MEIEACAGVAVMSKYLRSRKPQTSPTSPKKPIDLDVSPGRARVKPTPLLKNLVFSPFSPSSWPLLPASWRASLQSWDAGPATPPAAWATRLRELINDPDAASWLAEIRAKKQEDRREVLFDGSQGVQLIGRQWRVGEGSTIHDHGGAAGAETVVDGALVLTEYGCTGDRFWPRRSVLSGPGLVLALTPDLIHAVQNPLDRLSISLHLYGPRKREARDHGRPT